MPRTDSTGRRPAHRDRAIAEPDDRAACEEIGMDTVASYAESFGVYDRMDPFLSNALGAGETTLYKMVASYAMFANGGERIEPTLVDRVQDRFGAPSIATINAPATTASLRHSTRDGADDLFEPRAGAGRNHRLSAYLDAAGRGAARHRCTDVGSQFDIRWPARPVPPTTPRTSGLSALPLTSSQVATSAMTSRAGSPVARAAAPAARFFSAS